jgi:predicted enzyme related to lactoylglutathione lyase
MSNSTIGQVGWFDLTVPDAESLRTFYQEVVGWAADPIEMDGYSDYCMKPPGADSPVAGICHARGSNSSLPAQWLLYITVADLDESLKHCDSLGGVVVVPTRDSGDSRFAVIRDPAGAVCVLYQATPSEG